MKILSQVLCLLLVLAIAVAETNYQERVIYYTQKDNVCAAGARADTFELTIRLDGYPVLKVEQWGFTSCAATAILNWDAIDAADTFYYYSQDLGDRVLFENVLRKQFNKGTPLSQVLKTSASAKQCKLRGRPCSCKVIGDGTKQHFGINNPTHPPASIFMDCKFADTLIE